jgi:hypothetical protein
LHARCTSLNPLARDARHARRSTETISRERLAARRVSIVHT